MWKPKIRTYIIIKPTCDEQFYNNNAHVLKCKVISKNRFLNPFLRNLKKCTTSMKELQRSHSTQGNFYLVYRILHSHEIQIEKIQLIKPTSRYSIQIEQPWMYSTLFLTAKFAKMSLSGIEFNYLMSHLTTIYGTLLEGLFLVLEGYINNFLWKKKSCWTFRK